MTEKKLSQFGHNHVRIYRLVKTVSASFNAVTAQMTEMSQRKKIFFSTCMALFLLERCANYVCGEKKLSLSFSERAEIVTLSKLQFCGRNISKEVKVSKTAVHNATGKYQKQEFSRTDKDQVDFGFSSKRDERFMRKTVFHSPMSSAKNIRASLMERHSKTSVRTVQRRLSVDFGQMSCNPAKKTLKLWKSSDKTLPKSMLIGP